MNAVRPAVIEATRVPCKQAMTSG